MADTNGRIVNILGIRGVPGAHGGFETFATQLAPFLRDRGWQVNVYCQLDPDKSGDMRADFEDEWEGIRRINFGVSKPGSMGSFLFDWKCVRDVLNRPGIDLLLGYNTALFNTIQRLYRRTVIINMDGIEWKRGKWSAPVKAWFWLNEVIGAHAFSLAIADHPEIAKHLGSHGTRSVVIPYGAPPITAASTEPLAAFGIAPDRYTVSIARIEPENSLLEIVRGYSQRHRGMPLIVLGRFDANNAYHDEVKAAASEEVMFPGAIYDREIVGALRYHCRAYVHGHQVGGTNPSLIEALSAGNAVLSHDNRFTRWVAGPDQFYFEDVASFDAQVERIIASDADVETARRGATVRFQDMFNLDEVLSEYDDILTRAAQGQVKSAYRVTKWAS